MIGPAALVPEDFAVPAEARADGFAVLPLTWQRFPGFYESYRLSAARIQDEFGVQAHCPWPRDQTADFAALIAAWAEMEATVWRSSFTYVVVDEDQDRNLGACYIARSTKRQFEVECRSWTRADAPADLDESVHDWFRAWVDEAWPFNPADVGWPGRWIGWAEWDRLEDVSISRVKQ